MHKIFVFLFLFVSHTLISMDTEDTETFIKALPSDIRKKVFCIVVNQPTELCSIGPYDTQQRELLRHIFTMSELNTFLYQYINSFIYLQKAIFQQLPYRIKYPLACSLVLKSFNYETFNSLAMLTTKIDNYRPVESIKIFPGVKRYFYASSLVCDCIRGLTTPMLKQLMNDGADLNFMVDQGHCVDNIPAPLITLASDNTKESHEKLEFLIQHGADINLKQDVSFGLTHNGYRSACALCNVTPLAMAIAYNNAPAVKIILQHKPHNLCTEKAFLSANTDIKQLYLDYPLSQKDLDEGLKGALGKQHHDDIQQLLIKGASPYQHVSSVMERTISHILKPEMYQNCEKYLTTPASLIASPGSPSHTFNFLSIPLPNTETMGLLCQAGAYDTDCVEKLKQIQEAATVMLEMLEKNKP